MNRRFSLKVRNNFSILKRWLDSTVYWLGKLLKRDTYRKRRLHSSKIIKHKFFSWIDSIAPAKRSGH